MTTMVSGKRTNVKAIDYGTINPGVRELVRLLRDNGFDTYDSGDGTTREFECDLGIPYVHIVADPLFITTDSNRLVFVLEQQGVVLTSHNEDGNAKTVDAAYNPIDKTAVLTVWGVTDADLISK